ncbi:MAG: hypothetical protein M9933_00630 [Chitinophagaceae bacterium]|nr:hypothetical protein [Chitinophagaceae bacterium]
MKCDHNELKALLEFCTRNQLFSAVVTSVDKEINVQYKGVQLCFCPASVYAFATGAYTLSR